MKRYKLLIIALILLSNTVFAEIDPTLGRLFTSKKTRAELDIGRTQFKEVQPMQQLQPSFSEIETTDPVFKLQGAIIRSDGKTDIWLNNQSTYKHDDISRQIMQNASHIGKGQFQIQIPGGNTVKLRPGQSYSFTTGTVLESHENKKAKLSADIKLEPAVEEEITEPTQPNLETKTAEEFDESKLAEQDTKIKLLQERLEKLENSQPDK